MIRRSASGGTDDYGNEIQSESATTTVCELQQVQRSEKDQAYELSDTRWTIFFHVGEDIQTGDAVVVDGLEYEMIGDPWEVYNPLAGTISHIEATVRRTAGDEDAS